jgi:hypothetical protein
VQVVARYEDPDTGVGLYGERTTSVIQPGTSVEADITLIEPPSFMRNIVISGWVRVDDVYATGADHKDNHFSTTLFVQLGVAKFNQTTATWDPDSSRQILNGTTKPVSASTGDATGTLTVSVVLKNDPNDLSVDATVTGKLENLSHSVVVTVRPGQTVNVEEFDLDNGDTFPDRAYFRSITITNLPAQAI